ncbi:MAG: virulence-associated protein E [Alphaproteobacteria bacterium]|nr:MAG: virulence-associated protein E [Alphaproteobacteria bacterium]
MSLIALRPTQRVVDIVGALGGTWRGYIATCRCPAHEDRDPSLSVRQGHDGILVHCFAGCDPGDVLREISRVRPSTSFDPPPSRRVSSGSNVGRIWHEGLPVDATPAAEYLSSRGLRLPLENLRFHPRCPWGPKPSTRFLPALIVAVHEGNTLRAIQRIFLDVAHGGYLDKVMLGTPGAGAWCGSRTGDTLALAEGFETAAAFTQINQIPCWATLGAARLDRIQIPTGVTRLIIAEDNDPEGRRARTKAWRAYRERGLTLARMAPPQQYGDWADVLKPKG